MASLLLFQDTKQLTKAAWEWWLSDQILGPTWYLMFSLEEGASRESLLCAPCWPEAQETETPPAFALGGLQLRKGGKGMVLLLCNKSWPCLCCCLKKTDPSWKVSKVLEDACSVSKPCTPRFSAQPSLLLAPFTRPNQPSDLRGTP